MSKIGFRTRKRGTPRQIGKKFPVLERKLPKIKMPKIHARMPAKFAIPPGLKVYQVSLKDFELGESYSVYVGTPWEGSYTPSWENEVTYAIVAKSKKDAKNLLKQHYEWTREMGGGISKILSVKQITPKKSLIRKIIQAPTPVVEIKRKTIADYSEF